MRREKHTAEEKTADKNGLLSITGTKKQRKNAKKGAKNGTRKKDVKNGCRQSVMSAYVKRRTSVGNVGVGETQDFSR